MIYQLPENFKPVIQSSLFDWVENGCTGSHHHISGLIPPIFDAYLNICHPAFVWPEHISTSAFYSLSDEEQEKQLKPIKWCNVRAEYDGKDDYYKVFPSVDYNNLRGGDILLPREGIAPREAITAVERVVSAVTNEDDPCICAFWVGFNCVKFPETAKLPSMSQGPNLVMQSKRGALFKHWLSPNSLDHNDQPSLSPQAVWCPKKQWFYAVPFFKFSSLFAGSKEMVQELLKNQDLEAYELPQSHKFD